MNEPIQVIGQFSSARTLATGGVRVSIDIPEKLIKDCAVVSMLALQRQWSRITLEDYDQDKPTGKTKRKPGSAT
jgi:hypothetical protein